MPTAIFVIPTPGLQVRDPATGKPLPPEGALVVRSGYWTRRRNDGAVTITDPPHDKAQRKATAAPDKEEPKQ